MRTAPAATSSARPPRTSAALDTDPSSAALATVAPFGSVDGLVARAAERLVLVSRGVDPTALTVPEAGHLRLRREYESNLRGFATGTTEGTQAWLLYAAEAYTAGAQASPLVAPS